MKWLFIFFCLLMLFALFALRYRRQIQTALQVWRMFRQVRQTSKPPEKNTKKREIDRSEPLVRCAKCGKWLTRSDALNLRSKTFYCSANCMERAARIESLVDRN